MKNSVDTHIAIIGGGPAGLTSARILQGYGFSPIVYEIDTSIDSRDAGGTLDLHADSGQIALEDAGLEEAFHARARMEGQAKNDFLTRVSSSHLLFQRKTILLLPRSIAATFVPCSLNILNLTPSAGGTN